MTNASERNTAIANGWIDEGIAGYVFLQSGVPRCPLYRAWNQMTGNHLHTTDSAEYNGLSWPWIPEGIIAYVEFETVPDSFTAVSTGSGKMTLYWRRIPQAIGYNIYRGTTVGGENYSASVNGSTPVNALSYLGSDWCRFTDTGRTDGVEYFYTVKAVYSWGESAASGEDSDIVSANAIPWDTSSPAAVVNAVRDVYSSSGCVAPTFLRVMGPDGQIYADGETQVLPPDAAEVPGTNEIRLADGTRLPMTAEPPGVTIAAQGGQQRGTGPFRRVRSIAHFHGANGLFHLPAATAIRRVLPRDTPHIYLGSNRSDDTAHVDAGVFTDFDQNGELRGWLPFLYDGTHGKGIRPGARTLALGRLRFQPGHDVLMCYTTRPATMSPQDGKMPCLLRIEDASTLQVQGIASYTTYRPNERLMMKRVHSIAQAGNADLNQDGRPDLKTQGYIRSGAYVLGASWHTGWLMELFLGEEIQLTWDSSWTSESMEFPVNPAGIVTWSATTPYSEEDSIGIDLR
jgi:hypothetical protein